MLNIPSLTRLSLFVIFSNSLLLVSEDVVLSFFFFHGKIWTVADAFKWFMLSACAGIVSKVPAKDTTSRDLFRVIQCVVFVCNKSKVINKML